MTSTTLDRPALRRRRARPAPELDLDLDLDATTSPTELARAVGARRDLWAPHVRFDPDRPHESVLLRGRRWEVVLGAWLPGQASAGATAAGAAGALLVLQGELAETTWTTATDGPAPGRRHAVTRRYGRATVRSHGPVHVHELRNLGADPVVALEVRSVA